MGRGRPKSETKYSNQADDEPDDLLEMPFGYAARYGRFIVLRGVDGPESQSEKAEYRDDSILGFRQEQYRLHGRLHEVLAEADAVDLLARASLAYLRIDYETFKEWESDRSPAHIEYLALQVLSLGEIPSKDLDPTRAAALSEEAVALVRELFVVSAALIRFEGLKAQEAHPENSSLEYSVRSRIEALQVRGAGYNEHFRRVIEGCFGEIEDLCRSTLGFTPGEAFELSEAIQTLSSERIEKRVPSLGVEFQQLLKRLKHERRHPQSPDRYFPDWLIALPPSQAKQYVSVGMGATLLSTARSLACVTPQELAQWSGKPELVCRSFLEAFTCPSGLFHHEHHQMPSGAHPMTTQPILEVEPGNYLLAVPGSMIEAIRPRVEDLLTDTGHWKRYLKGRASFVEREAARLLSESLPGSQVWTAVQWRSPTSGSDLDGLVGADDLTLRLQCKGGRVSASTRRGAPARMKRDLGSLIEDAADQHEALDAALSHHPAEELGFTPQQASALRSMFQVEVIVCLDDVTVWATEAHELRQLGTLQSNRTVPWVVSLTDLMVVCDLLSGIELAHYIVRRQRLERDGRVSAHDEIDWLGHYLLEGLYFDNYFISEDPPEKLQLLSYTETVDSWYFAKAGVRRTPTRKPALEIPPYLKGLLQRLESERPKHWLTGGLALIEGDAESMRIWDESIEHATTMVMERDWSNASQGYGNKWGLTLMVDLRCPWPFVRTKVDAYASRIAKDNGVSNWVAIGEGESHGLFVLLLENDPSLVLLDVFLRPLHESVSPKQVLET